MLQFNWTRHKRDIQFRRIQLALFSWFAGYFYSYQLKQKKIKEIHDHLNAINILYFPKNIKTNWLLQNLNLAEKVQICISQFAAKVILSLRLLKEQSET